MSLPLAFGFGSPVDLFMIAFVLLPSVFWVVMLVDVVQRRFADSTTKLIWVLVVISTHFVGALVYYVVGRKQGLAPV